MASRPKRPIRAKPAPDMGATQTFIDWSLVKAGPRESPNAWRKIGAFWHIRYMGKDIQPPIKHSTGMGCIAQLLAQPERPISSDELLARADDPNASFYTSDETSQTTMDRKAIQDVKTAIADEEQKLALAEKRGEASDIAASKEEIQRLSAEYKKGSRMGRARYKRPAKERVRSNVSHRIRDAIKKIRGQSPDLGKHLKSIHRGLDCGYFPPPEAQPWTVDWNSPSQPV